MTPSPALAPADADRLDLETAVATLRLEADGLLALASGLDARTVAAIRLIDQAGGRLVVTGMGKSGHVARKIAATFASTGCPALYVHPGEASHGDLGMIVNGDVVLALSNSGETSELDAIIGHCKRFGIPLIGITSGAGSVLAREADVPLILPQAAEACPLGLAPTTSTTMMLALGDALAMALLSRRGFRPEDFRTLHPGGKLGQRLLRVADLMHRGEALPLSGEAVPMSEALVTMTNKAFGCLGVTDQSGVLVGIITDGDLRRKMSPELLSQSVGEIMTRSPKTVSPDMLAAEALNLVNASRITALFAVNEDGRPVGVFNVHDLLRAGVA